MGSDPFPCTFLVCDFELNFLSLVFSAVEMGISSTSFNKNMHVTPIVLNMEETEVNKTKVMSSQDYHFA